MTIIVGEDDENCVILLRNALEGLTDPESIHAVDSIKRLFEAIAEFSGNVDVVWLDLALRDSTAEQTVARLPEIRLAVPSATLIVASGWGDLYREKAISAGADAYAGKDKEVRGFIRESVSKVFIEGATRALQRNDVRPGKVLAAVASWLQRLASSDMHITRTPQTGGC